MIICICGSREFRDLKFVQRSATDWRDGDNFIIVGDARGVDATVRQACPNARVFAADWDKFGKRAGILRNIEMLDLKPDLVVAFWDGVSPGTKFMIDESLKRRIDLRVYFDAR